MGHEKVPEKQEQEERSSFKRYVEALGKSVPFQAIAMAILLVFDERSKLRFGIDPVKFCLLMIFVYQILIFVEVLSQKFDK